MSRTWSFIMILLFFPGINLFAQGGLLTEESQEPWETPPLWSWWTDPSAEFFVQEEPPQEEDDEAPLFEPDWADFYAELYTRGDRTFSITLGVLFPTVFFGSLDDKGHGLSPGGTGTLTFNYFLTPNVFIGGELSGMFAGTRGGKMIYIIPFGARIGYQFLFRRFEFPVSLMVGAAPQRYLTDGYFGLIVKPGASMFWRYNSEWSFGLNSIWWFVPQWPRPVDVGGEMIRHNTYGNFLELTLSARYHF